MDFEEFLILIRHREEQKAATGDKPEDSNLEIFKMFDKDGSGSLSPKEWLEVTKTTRQIVEWRTGPIWQGCIFFKMPISHW